MWKDFFLIDKLDSSLPSLEVPGGPDLYSGKQPYPPWLGSESGLAGAAEDTLFRKTLEEPAGAPL